MPCLLLAALSCVRALPSDNHVEVEDFTYRYGTATMSRTLWDLTISGVTARSLSVGVYSSIWQYFVFLYSHTPCSSRSSSRAAFRANEAAPDFAFVRGRVSSRSGFRSSIRRIVPCPDGCHDCASPRDTGRREPHDGARWLCAIPCCSGSWWPSCLLASFGWSLVGPLAARLGVCPCSGAALPRTPISLCPFRVPVNRESGIYTESAQMEFRSRRGYRKTAGQ